MPPTDERDPYVNIINCFSNFTMAEEEQEEDTYVAFDLKHSYNTRSKGLTAQDTPPTTSTQGICKALPIKEKVILEVEYNLADYLKRAKANISLFELLKIPSIRESFPKDMVLNKSREAHNQNL